MEEEHIQKFALGVSKISPDGKTWQVRVASKCEGITLEEALFYVEGWVEKVKKELKEKHFGGLQFQGNEK